MFGRNDNNKYNLKNGYFESHVGHAYKHTEFIAHYETSVNILYNYLQEKKMQEKDLLAIPLLFMMRHTLEIGLKAQIGSLINFSACDDSKNSLMSHDLEKLIKAFSIHFNKCVEKYKISKDIKNDFNKRFVKLEKIVTRFDEMDKKGDTFRYPKNKNGEGNMELDVTVNLLEIKNYFDEVMTLLYFTDSVISEYVEVEKIFESEMEKMYYDF